MGPRSLWLRRTRPAQSRDVRAWTTISSFVAGRACARSAVPYIDRTQLWATGLADSESGEWSDDLCGAFAVPRSQLPDIVDPTDVVGQLSRQAARATGLPPGLPVVAGLGDQTAALLALGRPDDTEMLDVVGTYPNLIVTVPEYRADLAAAGIHMIPSMYPHAWHPATFVIEGGRTLAWAVETLTGAAGGDRASAWSALERDAASVAPGCDGLTFIPHFATGGGSWRGLSWMHTSAHLYRAVLEGLTFELAIGWSRIQAATPAMHVAALVTYGGGARSELWSQIKSDVIGVPQAIPTEPDLPAVGAALTAAAGVGALDLSDVPAAPRTAGAYPSAAATGAYDGLIDVYRTQQEAPGVVRMVVRP